MDRYRPICTSKDGRSNWRAVMQIVRPHTTIDSDVELWVKESDVEALQARVRELEGLASEAVETAQFYGDQCEEWYQKKYDYDKVMTDLKERLNKLKGTP